MPIVGLWLPFGRGKGSLTLQQSRCFRDLQGDSPEILDLHAHIHEYNNEFAAVSAAVNHTQFCEYIPLIVCGIAAFGVIQNILDIENTGNICAMEENVNLK